MNSYKIPNIRVSLNYSIEDVKKQLSLATGINSSYIREISILKQGLDARKTPIFVLTVLFQVEPGVVLNLENYEPPQIITPPVLKDELCKKNRIIIIGAGPAGLMAAYILAQSGLKPIVIDIGATCEKRLDEQKKFLQTRKFNKKFSLLRGEGGAGTFSDGKLTTRRNDKLFYTFTSILKELGIPENILIQSKPHLGTDNLLKILPRLREKLISKGVEFIWETKFVDFNKKNGKLYSVITDKGEFPCNNLFLAIGGSSSELIKTLNKNHNIKIESRGLQLGVRIEHPAIEIHKSKYKKYSSLANLPVADYNFVIKKSNVRTFCMCPGGEVVCSSENEDGLVVNGMSYSKRDGLFSNSAFIKTLKDIPWEKALEIRENIEKKAFQNGGNSFKAPYQSISDFLNNRFSSKVPETSYQLGLKESNLRDILPLPIIQAFEDALPQLKKHLPHIIDGIMIAPETRVTPPYRIIRDENGQILENIFSIGEGSGYASGISTSAMDGLKISLNFVNLLQSGLK
jgi:uncharacterized protein